MHYCGEGKKEEFLHHGNAFCLKGLDFFLGAESSFSRVEDFHTGLQQRPEKICVNGELTQVECELQ